MGTLKDCTTCDSCEEILGDLNTRLIKIGDNRLYNIRYELGRYVDYDLFKLLMFYKGVLTDICNDEVCDCYYTVPLYYTGTSNTCIIIGYGSSTFKVDYGLSYEVGDRVRFTSNNLCSYVEGAVTHYYGTSMTVSVDKIKGSGEHCCWSIGLPPAGCSTSSCGTCGNTNCSCSSSCSEPVAVVNHCICGCCPPDNPVCTKNTHKSSKSSKTLVNKENILERIKILLA